MSRYFSRNDERALLKYDFAEPQNKVEMIKFSLFGTCSEQKKRVWEK